MATIPFVSFNGSRKYIYTLWYLPWNHIKLCKSPATFKKILKMKIFDEFLNQEKL